ncbi:MAG: sigma-54 dependent transcriptional regulator [Bryobacteraceae bacterium]
MPKRILILDDEQNIGLSLRLILEREGYGVSVVGSLGDYRRVAPRADLCLLDVRLPDGNGIDILREIRQTDARLPVIMISGQATIADAVEATRLGAFDFLEKPLSRDRVLLAIKNALEQHSLREENERLREIAASETSMVGESAAWRHTLEQTSLAARSDARILLLGESGTGKELLAAHVHRASAVAQGPFVKVNCAAIPAELLESELFGHDKGAFTGAASARRGKFELADGGSLFLDEVGDLPAPAQAKLLRVLQEGEFHRVGGERAITVTVRVISATNRDLAQLVAQGKFREDLYYRLNVMPVSVPPLRDRRDDIPALSAHFLAGFCHRNNLRPKQFDPEVFPLFAAYHWPGNVRELKNIVERMAILSPGEVLEPGSVPLEIRQAPLNAASSLQQARDAAERDHLSRALEHSGWNVSSAARALGMDRTNLHKRIRALGLERP